MYYVGVWLFTQLSFLSAVHKAAHRSGKFKCMCGRSSSGEDSICFHFPDAERDFCSSRRARSSQSISRSDGLAAGWSRPHGACSHRRSQTAISGLKADWLFLLSLVVCIIWYILLSSRDLASFQSVFLSCTSATWHASQFQAILSFWLRFFNEQFYRNFQKTSRSATRSLYNSESSWLKTCLVLKYF